MGLFSRLGNAIEARISMLIDGFESPGEALDYSYRRQLELDQRVKRGIAGVVVARKRLELQKAALADEVARLERDARDALAAGREDLASTAVQRKVQLGGQIGALDGQIAGLRAEQERLVEMERKLATKIELFCSEKETIKAQYSAARAKVHIKEATAGLGKEMDHVGYAVRMAQDRTRQLQAQSEALDELVQLGTIEDISGSRGLVDIELTRMRAEQSVKAELDKLKATVKPT